MTLTQLTHAMVAAIRDLSADDIRRECEISGTPLNIMQRQMRRYNAAHENAKRYGYVGVGCISFAEMRLARFNQRIGA